MPKLPAGRHRREPPGKIGRLISWMTVLTKQLTASAKLVRAVAKLVFAIGVLVLVLKYPGG